MSSAMKKSLMALVSLLFILFIVGCTTGTSADGEEDEGGDNGGGGTVDRMAELAEEDQDPVTLQVAIHWSDEMFNTRFKEPIEEAYPWITLEQIRTGASRQAYEEVFAAGFNPDILFEVSPANLDYFELDLDHDELIAEYGYDTSHINQAYLEAMRSKDRERRLIGIPYETVNWVLFYNKDVFDAFGEPYPTEPMTWDETLELAGRLTGEVNGIKYRGLDFGGHASHAPFNQFTLNKTDPETGEVLILDKPEFNRYLDLFQQLREMDISDEDFINGDKFTVERSTGMFVEFVQGIEWWSEREGLNYDVAPLPTWEKDPAYTHRADAGILHLSISPLSEHKEAAFRVLSHFTETEYQTFASRIGLGVISAEQDVIDQFFQDYESTHEMNIPSIFTNPPKESPDWISRWEDQADFNIVRFMNDEEFNTMDRNEYIRIVAEESQIKIDDLMAAE